MSGSKARGLGWMGASVRVSLALALLAPSLLVLAGCGGGGGSSGGGGSGSPDPDTTKIAENVQVLDAALVDRLDASSVGAESGTLVFASSVPGVAVGDVIAVGVTEQTPQGLLRRVTSIEEVSGSTLIDTEPLALTAVVEQGSFAVEGNGSALLPSSVQASSVQASSAQASPVQASSAQALRGEVGTAAYLAFPGGCTADGLQGSINAQTTGGLGVEAKVLDFAYRLALSIRDSAVESFDFALEPQTEGSLTASVAGDAKLASLTLFSCRLAPLVGSIGRLPVVVTPVVTATLTSDVAAPSGFQVEFGVSSSLMLGASYAGSAWTPTHAGSVTPTFAPTSLQGSVVGRMASRVDARFVFYETAGPQIGAEHILEFLAEGEDVVVYGDAAGVLDMLAAAPLLSLSYQETVAISGARERLHSYTPGTTTPVTVSLSLASTEVSLAEDVALRGREIATATAMTSDGSTPFYDLAPADAPFAIDAEGKITLTADLDHETQDSYTLTVTAEARSEEVVLDTAAQTLTVRVTDVFIALTFDPPVVTLFETAKVDDAVTTVQAVLVGSEGAGEVPQVTFDAAGAPFAFDSASGAVTVSETLTQGSYPLMVTASALGESVSATLTVEVTEFQDGSSASPYLVDTLAELQSIATGFQNGVSTTDLSRPDSLAAHYALTANIDASPTTESTYDSGVTNDVGSGFLPIGYCGFGEPCSTATDNAPFSGTFDGKGYTISGLFIDRVLPSTDEVGLFGAVTGTVQNVILEGGSISGGDDVGALVGLLLSGGTVQDSYATGLVSGDEHVGGLVGSSEGTVQDSYATGDVSGEIQAGGLVGWNLGTVQDSFATGRVRGSVSIGGLVGWSRGTVQASFAIGDVSGDHDDIGGLVGFNSIDGTVSSSFAIGDVSGDERVGGLVGWNHDGRVSSSFAAGDATGTDAIGGALGANTGLTNDVYALGEASCSGGSCAVGGLIGQHYDSDLAAAGMLRRAYYNGDAYSSDPNVGGDPGAVGANSVTVDGGTPDEMTYTGAIDTDTVSVQTETELKALACEVATFFRWDNDGDDPDDDGKKSDETTATAPQDCATATAASFPWDFGSSSEFPVLNGTIGGVLDAAAQRALLTFDASSLDALGANALTLGDEHTLDASALVTPAAGNTLRYRWNLPAVITDATFAADGSSVTFAAPYNTQAIDLTIIERDASGDVVGVYSGTIRIVHSQAGSAASPYVVNSLAELQSLAIGFQNEALSAPLTLAESLAASYVLAANIDASPTADETYASGATSDVGNGFLPIGNCGAGNCLILTDNMPFSGTFDGNGFVISGLSSDRASTNGVGLFAVASGTVQNVILEGGSISGGEYVGALVGFLNSGGTVQASRASSSISADRSVGGLVGRSDGTVQVSHASGSVSGSSTVGGLVGRSDGTVQASHATGSVFVSDSGSWSGGLVGSNGGVVSSSFATGSLFKAGTNSGGLVGSNSGVVSSSFATGSLSGSGSRMAGLVGSNIGVVSSSFATGNARGELDVGGLVGGNSGTVASGFATGAVLSINRIGTESDADPSGGVVGKNRNLTSDVYALGEADCAAADCDVGGIFGLNYNTTSDEEGTVRRAYYNLDAYSADPGAGDNSFTQYVAGTEEVFASYKGTVEDSVRGQTEAQLKALACAATTVFRWDNNGDDPDGNGTYDDDGDDPDGDGFKADGTTPATPEEPATSPVACSATNEASFPWDFGTSGELPVLNGLIGGVLDAAGQRALIATDARSLDVFSSTPGESISLEASDWLVPVTGRTLEYFWSFPPDLADVLLGADGSITFTAPEGDVTLRLTAIERDADGRIVGVYSDSVYLVVQAGTASSPYTIDSLAELQSLATGFQNEALSAPLTLAESLTKYYVMTADIDASDTASGTWQMSTDTSGTPSDTSDDVVQHGFLPIGNCGDDNTCSSDGTVDNGDEAADNEPFSGIFDGKGFVISGLSSDRASTDGVGLFGVVSGTVQGVTLEGGSIKGQGLVGALVGNIGSVGVVRDSSSSALVSGSGDRVGGLVGISRGTVQASFATGAVSGSGDRVGGLVGISRGTVQASFATGVVSSSGSEVGGLVGIGTGTVQASFAVGAVSSSGIYVGGLVGSFDEGTVQTGFATGAVSSSGSEVGGLVGLLSHGGTVVSSFATGDVAGADAVGGAVGLSVDLASDIYALGEASCSGADSDGKCVGGLVGQNQVDFAGPFLGTLRRAYYNLDPYDTDPGPVGDNTYPGADPEDTSDDQEATIEAATGISEEALRELTCTGAGASVFLWDHDGDDPDGNGFKEDGTTEATDPVPCSEGNKASFPWDFGEDDELPVLNGIIGGVLDAAGQRALVAFAGADRAASVAANDSLAAPSIAKQADANRLVYLWQVAAGDVVLTAGTETSATVAFTAAADDEVLALSILEVDDQGGVVRVYADVITLTVP